MKSYSSSCEVIQLVDKLCLLSIIANAMSRLDIVFGMCPPSRKRYHMVKRQASTVMSMRINSLLTDMAPIAVSLENALITNFANLCILLSRATPSANFSHFIRVLLHPLARGGQSQLCIFKIMIAAIPTMAFRIIQPSSAPKFSLVFRASSPFYSIVDTMLFGVLLTFYPFLCVITNPAMWLAPIFHTATDRELSERLLSVATCTSVESILFILIQVNFSVGCVSDFLISSLAYFAIALQTVFGILVLAEKFGCCRMPLAFFGTTRTTFEQGIILGYTVHMSELTFHSSRLGVYQHRSGTTLLPPHFTTDQPIKQLQGVLV